MKSFFPDIIHAFLYVIGIYPTVSELFSCTGSSRWAGFHHHITFVLRRVGSHVRLAATQSGDCSLSSSLHGALQGKRAEKGQGERWGHGEVCLFVRSRSVRCMGEQTGLCCVVKGPTLFLRAHCYHLYTEGCWRNYDSLSFTLSHSVSLT